MEWMFDNYIWASAFLLSVAVGAGLACQKKQFGAILKGAFNAVCGYLIFWVGAKIMVAVTAPIAGAFSAVSGVKVMIASNEAAVAIGFSRYAPSSMLILICSCAFNLIIARCKKCNAVFLTGHVLLFTSSMLAVMMEALTIWPIFVQAVVGGAAATLINILSMAMCQKYVNQITKNTALVLAHTGNPSVFIAGWLGTKFGNPDNSAEQWKIPQKWSFFREASIASAATMSVVFTALCLAVNSQNPDIFGNYGPVGYGVVSGVLFGIGIHIILLGIRMVTADLVTTLKLAVDKLAPGAKLGLDSPLFMNFAPNSWLLGFLISYPLCLVLALLLAGPVGLPYVAIVCSVPCFFDAGIAAVIGNATGGIRGVIISAVAHSVITVTGLSMLSSLIPLLQDSAIIWGGPDAAVFGTILAYILNLVGGV